VTEPNPFANFISGQLNPGLIPRSSIPTGRPTMTSDDPLALYRKTMATNLAPNIFDGVTVFRGIVLYAFPIPKEMWSLSRLLPSFLNLPMLPGHDKVIFFSCMIPELHAHLPNPYTSISKSVDDFIKKLELFPIFEPTGIDSVEYGKLESTTAGSIVEIQFSDPNRTHGYVSRVIEVLDSGIVPNIEISATGAFGSGRSTPIVHPGPGVKNCPERTLYDILDNPATSADIMEAYGDSPNMTQKFADKIVEVANNLGMDPAMLANAMFFESAFTFDPAVVNPNPPHAVGLIQFTPGTLKDLGPPVRTPEEVVAMSAEKQMDLVQEYFELERVGGRMEGRVWTQEDVFMGIYFPEAMGKGPDYSIYDYYYRNPMYDKKAGRRMTPRESAEHYKRINNGVETAGDYAAASNRKAKMCT